METKGKIVVIGSSNTDMVIKSHRLPRAGETILGGDFSMRHGGKGANQAVAAARLGGDVAFVCKVGDDIFGNDAIESLREEGIDTSFIGVSKDCPSGVALINVDEAGENCIAVASGANGALSVEDVRDAASVISQASIVMLQLETPMDAVECAARIAKESCAAVVLNPAPARKLSDELLSNVDILIPNVTEAELLSGMAVDGLESADCAIRAIASKGVGTVIITLGADGALAYANGESVYVPSFVVDALDTTGAGDTFCGALCVALSEGQGLEAAMRFANKASSIAVTRMGAQESIPYRAEIQ